MAEGNCAVVREVLLDQHMAVEASHFRNCKYADGTKGMRSNRQNLALCDVSPQLVVRGGLQAVKVISPGIISPSRVPFVTSTGRDLAMII